MPENKCEQQSLIQEFLDAPDSVELKARLDKHLAACQACHSEFRQYQKLFKSLGQFLQPPAIAPSAQQLKNIRTALVNRKPATKTASESFFYKFFALFSQPVMAMALIILLIVVAFVAVNKNKVTPTKSGEQFAQSLDFSKNQVGVIFNQAGKLAQADKVPLQLEKMSSFALGKTYVLPVNSVIQFTSGPSKVKLSQGAEFRLTSNSISLIKGKAHFSLKGEHDKFKLETPFAEISVIGTEFSAVVGQRQLNLQLVSGKILVRTRNGAVVELNTPNQSITVDEDGSFIYPDEEKSGLTTASPANNFDSSDNNGSNEDSGHSGHKLENSF